jgi:hypothetical protein
MRLKKSLTGKLTKSTAQVGEDKKVGKIQNARDFEGLVPKQTASYRNRAITSIQVPR